MIHDLTPYPAMKDSGVPWLGQVPEHWDLRSLGSLTESRSQRGRPDLPLLSVVREKGVILRNLEKSAENHNFIPDDLSNYKVVREGDLVVNKMKAWQGSMGLAPIDGIVSPAYFVFDFSIENRRFGQALLRSPTYVSFFAQASDGVRIGQWDLSIDGMKRIPVVLPPTDEQAAIVRFLDHADRRIRRTIAAKQKLIRLLQEQKQVIIHQAVTRGLDPDVKLKPSGVEWLGDVPEGWQLRRLKYLLKERDLRSATGAEQLLRVSQYTGVTERKREDGGDEPDTRAASLIGYKKVAPDELVVNIMLAWNGSMGVSRYAGIASPAYCVYSFGHEASPWYFHHLLRSPTYKARIKAVSTGVVESRLRLYTDDLFRLEAIVPPPDEQAAIVRFLAEATSDLSVAVDRAQQEILLLREYRTRLIADVVTGKLDVRAAAAALPDLEAEIAPEEADLEGEPDMEDGAEASLEDGDITAA